MWFVTPLEIAGPGGENTGRFRLTARSDDGGGGPHGDMTHDHVSAAEAEACERCRAFCEMITGMPGLLTRKPAQEVSDKVLYRHRKTGGIYRFLHNAQIEKTGDTVVVYQDVASGAVWIRQTAEFWDGRFESVDPAALSVRME